MISRKFVMTGLLTAALSSSACGFACGFVGNADKVLQQEFNPTVMRDRYVWFKDASAALDKKVADISVYRGRLTRLREDYPNVQSMPRDVREQRAIWESELSGVKASYNSLAAEYNSAMAKINWSFTNVGSLPAGATQVLPREYKPYLEE